MRNIVYGIIFVLCVSQHLTAQLRFDQFSNISSTSGLSQLDYSWGHSWGDPNGDGLPDVFVSNHYRKQDFNPPQLYYNQGDGTFLRTTVPFYESAPDMHGSGWFDFDNDGDQDLLVETGRTKRNFFLVNQGGGVFQEAAPQAGLDIPFLEGRGPLFIDQNRDGLLDVIHIAGVPISADLPPITMTMATDSGYVVLDPDENANLDELSSNMGFLADLDGDGQLNATIVTASQQYWYQTGCIPLQQTSRVSVDEVIEAISADFNGDLLPDLFFVRNDQVQSAAAQSVATNFGVYFGIDQIVPSLTLILNPPSNGLASLDSNANLQYQPNPGFVGLDSLEVGYCDAFERCESTVIYYMVQDSLNSLIAEDLTYPVMVDSSKSISIPKLVLPYPNHFKMVFQPQENDHGVKLRVASDSLYFVTGIPFLFPNNGIAIGSSGMVPSNQQGFLLRASDTLTHGLAPYTPGTEIKLYIGYQPSDSTWIISCNSNTEKFTGLLALFSRVETELLETYNFDTVFNLLPNQLLLKTNSGYVDATTAAGLDIPDAAVTAIAGDFDNDMDIDLYLSVGLGDGNRPNQLWENLGDGTFMEVASTGGASGTASGSAGPASTVDFNRDGFLDIFVEQGRAPGNEVPGPYELFQNTTNENHWIGFNLEGTVSNRDGIGASLFLYAGGKAQTRAADGGIHRYAQNDQMIHFGLGSNTAVDSLVVIWPSSTVQRLFDLPADQYITLVEPVNASLSCFPPTGLTQGISGPWVGLSWNAVACAVGYELSLNSGDSLSTFIFKVTDTLMLFPESVISPGIMYRWKVRALCEDSTFGSFSRTMIFSAFNECPAPTMLNSTQYLPDSVVLTWESQPNIINYLLYSRNAGSTDFSSMRIPRNKFKIPGRFLVPGSNYEWFVQPQCYFSSSADSSAVQSLSIPVARYGAMSGVFIQPNPARDQVLIRFNSAQEEPREWQLLDLMGTVVMQGKSAGELQLDVSSFPSGLYLFSWKSSDQTQQGVKYLEILR